MTIERLWQQYQNQGYLSTLDIALKTPLEYFYRAILAFGEQQIEQAHADAQQAMILGPSHLVYAEGAQYLKRILDEGKQSVYVTGDAFAAFIRGGGNVPLYEATSAALKQIYQTGNDLKLLDVGVGDGLALLPALTNNIDQVDLLEPSAVMLEKTTADLTGQAVMGEATNATLQEFMTHSDAQWDIIQGTYSLQSLQPSERPAALAWLREHCECLLIAEFDAPDYSQMYEPDRVHYIVDRYQQGLAEYADDNSLVAQGFLMPVFFGNFDQTVDRTNYEQPIAAWIEQLKVANFESVQTHLLYDYWWASAYLIEAR